MMLLVLKQLQSLSVMTPLGTGTKCAHKLMFLPLVSTPLNMLSHSISAHLVLSGSQIESRHHCEYTFPADTLSLQWSKDDLTT